ncbi:hypothetical protein CR158_11720 [Halomonas heilongjiangensis]|uniref:Uncharacterized protein n=1 Tax=Halomonas heilongjiangensis TaxID=1387883 RepID=A0A2N7TJK2_9GAMM|nr:hypothetical protein C1H66_15650 [Halomonas heilongjiangensis]PXX89062.1 hypothetical protein CR158_11720 [Halomonas heilongjiangensis]
MLEKSSKVAVLSRQQAVAKDYYERITQLSAAAIFVVIGSVVIGFVNLGLLIFMVGISLGAFLLTALVTNDKEGHRLIKKRKDVPLMKFRSYLKNNYKSYIGIISSITFLSSFLFILYPYVSVQVDQTNLLLSLLSLIVMRQCVKSSANVVSGVVSLSRDNRQVDALFFKKKYYHGGEKKGKKEVRRYFMPEARDQLIEKQMRECLGDAGPAVSHWRDSPVSGISFFEISTQGPRGNLATKHLLQVFHPRFHHLLDKEELLFSYVERERVHAPDSLLSETVGGFKTQLVRYGRQVPPAVWRTQKLEIFMDLWGIQPPKRLVREYRKSHPLMQDRLTEEMIGRLSIAADRENEIICYQRLMNSIDELNSVLKGLPLYIHNPDIRNDNAVGIARRGTEGRAYKVLTWGRWSLQPIGIEMANNLDDLELADIVESVRSRRKDITPSYGINDIRLAAYCWEFETAIRQGKYNYAIEVGESLLESFDKIRDVELS